MKTLVYVCPLKLGKLEAYKAFTAQNIGPRKKEYIDLLRRYGLKFAKVHYHKLGNKEFVMVIHDAEDDSTERLAHFATSTNPYDQWFLEQLADLVEGSDLTECLLSFTVSTTS